MSIRVHKAPIGKLAQTIESDPHTLLTDVNAADGGDDLAPDPHALLDSALGACTALTVKMYAARKGWPLENADVVITHEESPGHYRLLRQVTLRGELTEEQRTRLLEIANKCPIHRVLSGEISIETELT
ncbi:MAG: OsmC family peroxiredoxin [Moraxellaceae bacterium]|jgi:putative redox protein|nr:OsmC family peroxiredoxin [Moraxellaceae bacterium]